MLFEPISPNAEATRLALHRYSQAAISVSRAHGVAHPKWWHVSLKVRPEGLISDPVPLPDGGIMSVGLDIARHAVVIRTNSGFLEELSMTEGVSGSVMGGRIIEVAKSLGLDGPFDHSKFESDDPHAYVAEDASRYMAIIATAHTVFERHRVTLGDSVGPVQLWPHGFDLAFEWFGTKAEMYESELLPSQLNLGLYLSDRPYFYSNPWPFDEALTDVELPHGAEWHTEGWQGSILHYDKVVGDPTGPAKVEAFAQAVHEAAAPTLTA